MHLVSGLAGKVVGLLKVERLARLHLVGFEISAAFAGVRARQGVRADNQRLPFLVRRGPVAGAREFGNGPNVAKQALGSRVIPKSCDCGYQGRVAFRRPTGAFGRFPVAAEIGFAP